MGFFFVFAAMADTTDRWFDVASPCDNGSHRLLCRGLYGMQELHSEGRQAEAVVVVLDVTAGAPLATVPPATWSYARWRQPPCRGSRVQGASPPRRSLRN